MNINSKYGEVKIFTEKIDSKALAQITDMANSPLGENAHIRIMPDCHAGLGCTIGTTMLISDKICPNLIGVDIGCGVDLIRVEQNLKPHLDELDRLIRRDIPHGFQVHNKPQEYPLTALKCWPKLSEKAQTRSQYSLGTLGGGNHFIEAYTKALAVHSGSRNIGQEVALYYQKLAQKNMAATEISDKNLAYLTDLNREDYLHDMQIVQQFALANRQAMLDILVTKLKLTVTDRIVSTHNYIDLEQGILRKGAIAAQAGQRLVIPLNMRDGLLVCVGKGNPDWNYSAPHGAGRLYSRNQAKEMFKLSDYQQAMQGIYSSCVHKSTIDESPFAYKDYREIMAAIEPTVEISERLQPIFNFKAS